MENRKDKFIMIPCLLFDEEPYKNLSVNAKWMYVMLKHLSDKYAGKNRDFFYRSNAELAEDCGFSERTVVTAKAELIAAGLIKLGKVHFIYNSGTPDAVKSKKHISSYRILK